MYIPDPPVPGDQYDYWTEEWGIPTQGDFLQYLIKYYEFGIDPEETVDAWQDPGNAAGQLAYEYLSKEASIRTQLPTDPYVGPGLQRFIDTRRPQPMPPLIIPNVYRVAIVGTCGAQQVVNVLGVRGTSSGLAENVASAALLRWTAAGGPLSQLSAAYLLQSITVTDLSSSTGGIAVRTSTAIGGNAVNPATAGACALIKWNGGTRSRSTRGRVYFGPITESQVDTTGQTLTSAARISIDAAWTQFRTAMTTDGYPLVVISRTLNLATDVTGQSTQVTIATQRGRIR